jgi:hypothetical protein
MKILEINRLKSASVTPCIIFYCLKDLHVGLEFCILCVALTTHHHLVLRLKKVFSYNSTATLGLRGLFWGDLYLCYTHLYLILINA